ncbi:glycosyltransferase [Bdellovibrio sp. HCB290]|uniref:glycosyltransferase n=1 Tax=Bdellovibrio sp. HCB290 TaxID=3394356 RepID=UPI0039B4BA77
MSVRTARFHNIAYERSVRPQVTLCLAFYNNTEFFNKVFASIEVQKFRNFELIICDDGSGKEAVSTIRAEYEHSAVSVVHLWHEDRGFYKNEMLNRAILQARGEYLVFVDGDCILHPEFLKDHWNNRREGHTLAGRRVELTPRISSFIKAKHIRSGFLHKNWWWLFIALIWMKDNNALKGFRITSFLLYKILNRKVRSLVGCNFSVSKTDLYKVNGFDMTYTKPGTGEDSDVDYRLSGVGVTPISLCYQGIQYHLYHKAQARSSINEEFFRAIRQSKQFITRNGLSELLQKQTPNSDK